MDGHASPPIKPRPPPDWVPRRLISVDDYHRMGEAGILRAEDRVELIEGELIAMPALGRPHIMRVVKLTHLLVPAAGDRALVSIQNSVRLSRISEPEPDIALLHPRFESEGDSPPLPEDVLLLIEVADSSARYDHTVKADLYARHGIAEHWIVDLDAHLIRLHRDPVEAGYGTVRDAGPGDTLEPLLLPGLRLSVADLLA